MLIVSTMRFTRFCPIVHFLVPYHCVWFTFLGCRSLVDMLWTGKGGQAWLGPRIMCRHGKIGNRRQRRWRFTVLPYFSMPVRGVNLPVCLRDNWNLVSWKLRNSDLWRYPVCVSWSKDRDTSHWSCLQNSELQVEECILWRQNRIWLFWTSMYFLILYHCLHFCTLQPSWGGQKAYHCIHQAPCWRFFVKHLPVDHQITIHFKRVVAQTKARKKVVHPPTKLQQRFCLWDRRNFLQWWTRQLYRQIVIFLFHMLIWIINTYRYIYHILYRHLISSSNFPVQNQGVRVHSWFLSVIKFSCMIPRGTCLFGTLLCFCCVSHVCVTANYVF